MTDKSEKSKGKRWNKVLNCQIIKPKIHESHCTVCNEDRAGLYEFESDHLLKCRACGNISKNILYSINFQLEYPKDGKND